MRSHRLNFPEVKSSPQVSKQDVDPMNIKVYNRMPPEMAV
jgi:hypothetical protein